MATATATAVQNDKAEVIEEPKQRGRKKGQKLFNHDQFYNSKEDAEANAPYYSQEVVKKEKVQKDGKEVEVESIEYEGEEEAEGFRLYKVELNHEVLKNMPNIAYVWGRNGDMSIATFGSQFIKSDLLDAKPRGRARKIDQIYVMFFLQLIEQGKTDMFVNTLKEQELTHYLQEPMLNAALKAKGLNPDSLAA
jgi:hypothetical protein